MQVRIIKINEENEEKNKLLSYFEIDEKTKIDELIKSFYAIKKIQSESDDFGIELNIKDIADYMGDWYNIVYVSINVPKINGQIQPYIAVYVDEMY